MARIAGINIPVNKHAVISLQAIYGIGRTRAQQICEMAKIAPDLKVRDLNEAQVDALRAEVTKYLSLIHISPKGLMSDRAARAAGHGGEVLCAVA